MTLNTSLFNAQSGDFGLFNNTLTLANAQHFENIYLALNTYAEQSNYTLLDYVQKGICVALPDYPLDAVATLKGLNLIICADNLHIGLTLLGYDYYEYIKV